MNRLTILLLVALPFLFACTQKEQEVRVESVSVSPAAKELTVGENFQLSATVSPSAATRKDITWSSSKSSVASVSSSGLVSAVSEGTTTITASADGKKGECTITVSKAFIAVSEIKLGKTELTIYEGEEETLTASVLPDNATDRTIQWSSSDDKVATVKDGKITAVQKGEATISATAGGKKAEVKVHVLAALSGLSLNKTRLDMIVGDTETLTATLEPEDASVRDKIEWTSSNTQVATVSEGKVTALKEGEATITASLEGKKAECKVVVDYVHVTSLTLDKTEAILYIGESLTLVASLSPEDATYKSIEWTSSTPAVASVSADGKVDAVGKGKATITAKADGKTGTCQIEVLAPVKGITLSTTTLGLEVGQEETLIATLVPSDATPKGEIVWASSNIQVATVESGKVKAIEVGTATISVSVDGYQASCTVSVSKPTYPAPSFTEVDVPRKLKWWNRGYDDELWYYHFHEKKQQFIYPHLLTSYIASEWYKADNLEYIIMGEVPEETPCENIGIDHPDYYMTHADDGYNHIKMITPVASIKACGGSWDTLLPYVEANPDKLIMVSCAADWLGADSPEDLQKDPEYLAFKAILAKENVIVSTSAGNIVGSVIKTIEETHPYEPGGSYKSASVSSLKNNKYTVCGYDAVYYLGSIFWYTIDTRLPVGFGKGNHVVPFIELIGNSTHSSFPTAAFSSTLGNFLSILLKTHPGVTLEGASTIMQENYFRAEKMKYKDDDGVIKEGEDWHFFKTDEFIASEILQTNAVDAAFSASAQVIDLPSTGGLCYIGPGIQFEVDGTAYEMTEQNRSRLVSSLSAGKEIKWTFNRTLADKYATGSASILVRVLDHAGELIPEIKRTVTVGI